MKLASSILFLLFFSIPDNKNSQVYAESFGIIYDYKEGAIGTGSVFLKKNLVITSAHLFQSTNGPYYFGLLNTKYKIKIRELYKDTLSDISVLYSLSDSIAPPIFPMKENIMPLDSLVYVGFDVDSSTNNRSTLIIRDGVATSKIQKVKTNNKILYFFTVHGYGRTGYSGSPVLKGEKIVGILRGGDESTPIDQRNLVVSSIMNLPDSILNIK